MRGCLPIMDNLIGVVFIIIGSSKATSGALTPPVYLWPFHNRTMAFEVFGAGIDGRHPTIGGCFRVSPVPYRSETKSPLFLDGTRESYIDLNIPGNKSFPSFGFFLAFYPHVTSGMIFHYQSNNPASLDISQITIKLDQGDLHIVIKDGGGGDLTSLPVITTLQKMVWQHVSLSFNQPTGELEIHSNFSLVASVTLATSTELAVPGVLRIGAGANNNDFWVGAVRCMMMYDQGKGFNSRQRLIDWHCSRSWNYIPKEPKCFSSPTDPNITLLWPFDEQAGVDEVKTHIPPLTSTTSLPRYRHVFTALNGKKAIYLDGSKYSSIDLKLRKNLIQGDFSIAMMIFPNMFNGSGIFTIKNETSSTGLNGINVIVTSDGYVRVTITSGSTECLDFLVQIRLAKGEWNLLAIQRFSVARITSVIVNGSEYTSQDTCMTSPQQNSDLILTFGGDTNNIDRYLGSIRCLGLFDSPFWPTKAYSRLLETCTEADVLSYNSTVDPVYEDIPSIRSFLTKGHPNRAIRNGHLDPIKTLFSKSKIGCGRTCLETNYCRSFSVEDDICKIYDFVSVKGLTEHLTSFYFIRN